MRASVRRRLLGTTPSAASVPVRINLLEDFRAICAKELAAEGFPVATTDSTEDLVRRAVNVARRRIVARKRPVRWSRELRAREPSLPAQYQRVLVRIEGASGTGDDLTPYLSRKVVGSKKKAAFTDHSLCEWDIHHMHLGDGQDADGKIKGTKELLFVIARDEALYFIDVLDHDSFGEQYLFDTVLANWPELYERSELRTVVGRQGPALSPEERELLRKKGVNALTVGADGKVYGPIGGGIASDGSSSKVTNELDRIFVAIQHEERMCREHADEIRDNIWKSAGIRLAILDLKLVHAGNGVFKVMEMQTKRFVVPAV